MTIQDVNRVFKKLQMETRESGDTIAKFRYNGKVVLRSKVSHGKGELQGSLPHLVCQQLRVSRPEFDLISGCKYSRPEYEQILRDKGVI